MITFKLQHHGFTPFGDDLAKNAAALAALNKFLDAGGETLSNVIKGPQAVVKTGVYVSDETYFNATSFVMVYPRQQGPSWTSVESVIKTGYGSTGGLPDSHLFVAPSRQFLTDVLDWAADPLAVKSQSLQTMWVHDLFASMLGMQDGAWTAFPTKIGGDASGQNVFNGRYTTAVNGEQVRLTSTPNPPYLYDYYFDTDVGIAQAHPPTGSTFSPLDLALLMDMGFTIKPTLVAANKHVTFAGPGNAKVTGTNEVDYVYIQGQSRSFSKSHDGAEFVFTDTTDSANVIRVSDVERVRFDDVALAFDADTNHGAELYRLYQAVFNRTPDIVGIGQWMQKMDAGMGLETIADYFLRSYEFNYYYYSLSDEQFIARLYNNVLDRAPDSEGLAAWVNALQTGMSRTTAVLQFSESFEAEAKNIIDANGRAAQVYRLYQAAFDRSPDTGGMITWLGEMEKGMSLSTVSMNFIGSDEFKGLYGSTRDHEQFITGVYKNVLHRTPDVQGLNDWLNAMDTGMTAEDLLLNFSESVENRLQIVGVIQDSFEYAPVAGAL